MVKLVRIKRSPRSLWLRAKGQFAFSRSSVAALLSRESRCFGAFRARGGFLLGTLSHFVSIEDAGALERLLFIRIADDGRSYPSVRANSYLVAQAFEHVASMAHGDPPQ
jgi:hypothetical protein